MENKAKKIKVGITHGDINGIGYEIIIKTLTDKRITDLCIPIVYGSPKLASYHRKSLNIENFSLNIIKSPDNANPKRPNVINCVSENTRIELGKLTKESGAAAFASLEAATNDLTEGKIDVLITAPINSVNAIVNPDNLSIFFPAIGLFFFSGLCASLFISIISFIM